MKIKITGIGYAGGDPEIVTFKSGDKIAKLSVGVTESWKNKDGEKQSKTEWGDLVFSGGLVGVVESYIKKGSRIYFEGKQHTEKWESENGEKRQRKTIRVSEMEMLGENSGGNSSDLKGSSGSTQSGTPSKSEGLIPEDKDGDLPF